MVHEPVRLADFNALVIAILIHAGLAFGVVELGRHPPPERPRVVEVDVHKVEPPPRVEPPPPEEPPPPPPKKVKVKPQKLAAPIPNQEQPKPPAEPPKIHFGATEASTTTGPSDFTIPVGNSTIADPSTVAKKAEPVKALPPAPPGAVPAPVFKPASPLEIKEDAGWDEESCKTDYPEQARQEGLEGRVVLRVEIDDQGKVHGVRVLRGVAQVLDDAAIRALKHKCRFTPARTNTGRAVPTVITYTYTWELST